MTKLCIGFEVHQPYRLDYTQNTGNNGSARSAGENYFSEKNRQILERVAEKCYIPTTRILLEALDEGLKCAFSLSGTAIEQMERWSPDTLELFRQVARHKNTEILAQTYYHSLASLFDDFGEFEQQLKLHAKLMKDEFGVKLAVLENTELILNNDIAKLAERLGYKAVYTEGAERVLGWRSPNYVYSCNGIKLLLRNYRLSDDIALHFNHRQWDQYPLTAEKYASWIAASPGDYVNVFLGYETFGEHQGADTGIIEFLKWLPGECMNKGVDFTTPSEVADMEPREELSIPDTVSIADSDKDTSAWLGNPLQRTAVRAVQLAKPYAKDKRVWRNLQASDNFYYMASRFGPCANSHYFYIPKNCQPYLAFCSYMSVLSQYEKSQATKMKRKPAAMVLRTLPPREAFHFFSTSAYTGFTAYGLDDFTSLLDFAPADSIDFHMRNGDFASWIAGVLGDRDLADAVGKCTSRVELSDAVDRHRTALRASLQ
ncbi:MAG TPA: alpha-amylase [Methanocella sp.]|nr:alpha-amylase [Methanocella sp.]